MARWIGTCCGLYALGLMPMPAQAEAKCQIVKYLEIPVTMAGRRPIVTAQINGRDARFILDSGAFFSTIAKANALEYGLSISPLNGARLRGIGGDTSLSVATAKVFTLAGHPIPHVEFAVGGSDTGYAGLLGQNILGLVDAEYDLPHGAVRLMKGKDCRGADMAYWADGKPFSIVPLMSMDAGQRHTIGTIKINGVSLKAVFDTGAEGSMLTLSAARRIGVTPDSPGVTASGFAYGLGTSRVRSWRARFDTMNIGGEMISKPWIEIADQSLDDADMLIGVDFFTTHRVYVDNQGHRMFLTYEGGPLFGLNPKRAVDSAGTVLDTTDHAGEPTDAAGYGRRGAILASGRKFDAAIADFDKAVALDPTGAHYVFQRAMAHLANDQPLLGAGDLDKAIALAPADADARLARASLRHEAKDPDGAAVDLAAADKALARSSDARLQLASLYDATDAFDSALANYDLWLSSHPEDRNRAVAFNGRCWARALLNRDLDKALADCNAALRLRPGEGAYLDSRALVQFRRGAFDKALADYDAALAKQPRNAWSLYCRGIVARRLGKAARADTDQAAALAIDAQVRASAKRYGLES